MISYLTLGTDNLERALAFYDPLMKALGGDRQFEAPNGQFYGDGAGALLGILRPADGHGATPGNGTMVAFKVESPDRVNAIYQQALSLGAVNAGKPGPRGERGFYAAYFRDLDQNKLCVYTM